MKRNSFWFIIALCAMISVKTSSAMEKSQSWYDWGASGVSSGLSYGQSLYDQLPTMSSIVQPTMPNFSIPLQSRSPRPNEILPNGTILAPWKTLKEEKDQSVEQKEPVSEEKPLQKEKKIPEKKEIKQSSQNQKKEVVEEKKQEKNVQNIEYRDPSTNKEGVCEPEQYTFGKVGCTGSIFENGNNVVYSISNECYRVPGIYYRIKGKKDLMSVSLKSNDGREMVKNQLGSLSFSNHVLEKKNGIADKYHNFPECIEKNFGECARVVIEKTISSLDELRDSKNKYILHITIPGSSKREKGVFEFVVEKSLYEESGECKHRFFRPKGICGEKSFGIKKNNNTNYRHPK